LIATSANELMKQIDHILNLQLVGEFLHVLYPATTLCPSCGSWRPCI